MTAVARRLLDRLAQTGIGGMMTSRRFLTTIGATALGVGVVIGGGATAPLVFAQEETPAVEAPAQGDQAEEFDQLRAEAYDNFVAALASELNVDEADVDTAIRDALKQQIAAQEADGNLEADIAAELQTMIDESDAPLGLGMGGMHGFAGRGGMHGFMGRGGEHRGPRGGFIIRDRDRDATQESSDNATTPASLPAIDEAADQAAPATAPADEVTIIS